MKTRASMHDVIEWIQEVGNDKVLEDVSILVEARRIYIKYFCTNSV